MGWLMETALDGIVGGVIGGAVTGGAVWATIRHERKVRTEEREEQQFDALLQQVSELRAGAFLAAGHADDENRSSMHDSVAPVLGLLFEVTARARGLGGGLTAVLDTYSELLTFRFKTPPEDREMTTPELLSVLHADLLGWMANPALVDRHGEVIAQRIRRDFEGIPYDEEFKRQLVLVFGEQAVIDDPKDSAPDEDIIPPPV